MITLAVVYLAFLLLVVRPGRKYTCAEMFGTPPRGDGLELLPPHYSYQAGVADGHWVAQIKNDHNKVVCQADLGPVKPLRGGHKL